MFILFKSLFDKYKLKCSINCSPLLVNLIFVKYIHSSKSTLLFTVECPPGQYGDDCSNQCSLNCNVTRTCDKFTGQCEGGCKPGFTGNTCDQGKCLTILSKRTKR